MQHGQSAIQGRYQVPMDMDTVPVFSFALMDVVAAASDCFQELSLPRMIFLSGLCHGSAILSY